MELDDLRRQWQQAPAPPPVPPAEMQRLLEQQSGSIVVTLRRNARLELGINYALLALSLAVAGWAPALWLRLFGALLALVAGVCIYYFYRKLGVLRTMDNPAGHLRGHLLRLTKSLRALIRFYYRFTLAMIPVTMLACGLLVLTKLPSPVAPLKTGLLLGLLALLGAALYWPVGRATAWYLHRLYGQHLDRLEGQLRELEAEKPG